MGLENHSAAAPIRNGWHAACVQTPPLTDKDILPIVQRCTQCHGGDVEMGNLDLSTRPSILLGGNCGVSITPGCAPNMRLT